MPSLISVIVLSLALTICIEARQKRSADEDCEPDEEPDCKSEETSADYHVHLLAEDLEDCLSEGFLSDVTVKVGHHEFAAHRVILAARSKVFLEQFEEEEDEEGCISGGDTVVEIEDAKINVVEAFLKYIYAGKLPKSENLFHKVCELCEEYQVQSLAEECEFEILEDYK